MVRDLSKNNELILEAKNVTKQFKVSKNNTLTACDNINLSMYKGKTLGIVGESGCGKSTFLRMLMNLEKISSGEIFYKGKDISKFSKDEIWKSRQHIQMVYQDPGASFSPRMKVIDILTEPLINY
ncbi:ATP-binding cassette domain-containing protein, partial [uncultured Fusobacterium sp.]